MTPTDFGTLPDGRRIRRFELSDGHIEVAVTDYGAALVAVRTPDRDGRLEDVLLGHDEAAGYLDAANPHLGATIGRVAGRIDGAAFTLNGTTYRLVANEGRNHLHGGGDRAFHRVVWDVVDANATRLALAHVSRAGEEGYPGEVEVNLVFEVADGGLSLDFRARSDAPTPVNLTSHGYFNLGGEPVGPIDDHEVAVFAGCYAPVGENLIPTGEIAEVDGTPVDLRAPARLGDRLPALDDTPAGGFDHFYVVDGEPGRIRPAARVFHPGSGRSLEVHTDQRGVVFYSGNMFDGAVVGRAGRPYDFRSGFCLEPQDFPDAVNQTAFPSIVLAPGDEYRHRSRFVFDTD